MKTLIYTTFFVKNKNYEVLIWEWLISLRTLGKYTGEVIIFDYGLSEKLVEKLTSFELGNVKIIKLPIRNTHSISNWRNIDVIPYLEEYKDYYISHFDADIWFQRDVNIMFDDMKTIDGCYLAIEKGRSCGYRGPKEFELDNKETQKRLNGFIFGGWIAGKYEPFINKLKKMKSLFEKNNGWDITVWGTDQSMITHIIDFEKDNTDGLIYGCSNYFCKEKNNKLICVINKENSYNYIYQNREAVGVHMLAFGTVGTESEEKYSHFRFKNRYPELWEKYQ